MYTWVIAVDFEDCTEKPQNVASCSRDMARQKNLAHASLDICAMFEARPELLLVESQNPTCKSDSFSVQKEIQGRLVVCNPQGVVVTRAQCVDVCSPPSNVLWTAVTSHNINVSLRQ